ncbi:hypothetical protein ABZS66_17105 [Dactylosporangium sp. NPDC005572]|uniref:hypothetical protein n=1 Tax=Dactylosporangium sp. NPDC005572 TaxID=3156889 RepID=UPI0033A1BA26
MAIALHYIAGSVAPTAEATAGPGEFGVTDAGVGFLRCMLLLFRWCRLVARRPDRTWMARMTSLDERSGEKIVEPPGTLRYG